MSGFAADHPDAIVRPSPNFGPRRGYDRPNTIILHYTGMKTGQGAEDWLCTEESQVSSHYLVHEDGRIVQMVREADRAWHAGRSFWRGETDINSCSVGIEIVNPGHQLGYPNFGKRQIEAVIGLCQGIIARYAIAAERVLAHSDVAPGRKVDPGEKFPWRQLATCGVGHFVAPKRVSTKPGFTLGDSGDAILRLQSQLAAYGYEIARTGVYDALTSTVVRAFQLHFRPRRVDGLADSSTIETLSALISALSADECLT